MIYRDGKYSVGTLGPLKMNDYGKHMPKFYNC